jgi:hypothetical protein
MASDWRRIRQAAKQYIAGLASLSQSSLRASSSSKHRRPAWLAAAPRGTWHAFFPLGVSSSLSPGRLINLTGPHHPQRARATPAIAFSFPFSSLASSPSSSPPSPSPHYCALSPPSPRFQLAAPTGSTSTSRRAAARSAQVRTGPSTPLSSCSPVLNFARVR